MSMHPRLVSLLSLTLLFLGSTAHAQSTAAATAPVEALFGAPSQLVISTDASFSIQRRTQKNSGGATTTITLAPAADYFILRNFSLGGFVGLDYTKTAGRHSSRFAFGPRVGYNIALGRLWSIWPKLGFSYAHTGTSDGAKANAIALNVFVPLLLHPAPHFFLGLGPFVDTDLNGDHRATVWGVKLTLGGWL
ncbi:MAG TPA: hypothetical protein VG963_13835 [Polyangiaceae bacterium]|nr:hypothetical protein [Polyangiaceae bacterium]